MNPRKENKSSFIEKKENNPHGLFSEPEKSYKMITLRNGDLVHYRAGINYTEEQIYHYRDHEAFPDGLVGHYYIPNPARSIHGGTKKISVLHFDMIQLSDEHLALAWTYLTLTGTMSSVRIFNLIPHFGFSLDKIIGPFPSTWWCYIALLPDGNLAVSGDKRFESQITIYNIADKEFPMEKTIGSLGSIHSKEDLEREIDALYPNSGTIKFKQY